MAVDSKTIVLTPVTGTSTLELDVVNLDSPAYSNVRLSPVSNTTVTALGPSDYVVEATFDSHGHGTAATAVGASTSAATAAASGTGSSSVVGSTGVTVVSATASASGTSTVSASGTALKPASASASGTSTVAAAGRSFNAAVGSAAGVGSAASTGLSVTSGAGLASGLGSVASVGASTAVSTASASGTGTPSSAGRSIYTATASASAASSVSAAGQSTFSGVAVSTGSASVSSVGGGIAAAQAAATGTGTLAGVVQIVSESVAVSTGNGVVSGGGGYAVPYENRIPANRLIYLWGLGGGAFDPTAGTGPLGGEAALFTENTANDNHSLAINNYLDQYLPGVEVPAGEPYTYSVYVRPIGERNLRVVMVDDGAAHDYAHADYDLQLGTVVGTHLGEANYALAGIEPSDDGYWRVWISVREDTETRHVYGGGLVLRGPQGSGYPISYAGDEAAGIEVWARTFNLGVGPAPYIETGYDYEAAFESTGLSVAESEGTAVTWSVAYASGTGELLFEAEVSGSIAQATGVAAALADTQFLYSLMPDGVLTRGGWTTESGGTTDLYLSVDEGEPDDADYIRSVTDPVGDRVELSLGDPPLPVGDEFVVEYRYGKGGTTPVDIRVNLRCEGDLIASWFHANVTTDMTTVSQTLSPSEVASIADPGALTVEIIANP